MICYNDPPAFRWLCVKSAVYDKLTVEPLFFNTKTAVFVTADSSAQNFVKMRYFLKRLLTRW